MIEHSLFRRMTGRLLLMLLMLSLPCLLFPGLGGRDRAEAGAANRLAVAPTAPATPAAESWTFLPPDWMTGAGHVFSWNSALRKESTEAGLLVAIDEASALAALQAEKSKIDVFAVGAQLSGNATFAIPFPVAKAAYERSGADGALLLASSSGSFMLPLSLLADNDALEGAGDVLASIQTTGEAMDRVPALANAQGLRHVEDTPVAEFRLVVSSNGEEREIADFGRTFVQSTIALGRPVFDMESTAAFHAGQLDDGFPRFGFAPTRFYKDSDGTLHAIVNRSGNGVFVLASRKAAFRDLIAHWSRPAVDRLAEIGIVNGRTPECFGPDVPITRSEFVAMLVRGLGLQDKMGSGNYSDVAERKWFASDVRIATAYGLVSGYDGEMFPQVELTRQELAVLLANALRLAKPEAVWNSAALDGYSTEDQPAGWAAPSMSVVLGEELFGGLLAGRLEPRGFVTRGEAAVSLELLLRKLGFIYS
jgi:S-layer homology domain.